MAEKTSSNSNEAFSEAEKNELQVETKRAQYYVSVLEQEIHMLQQEMSEISRESEEWNIQYKEISSTIINKRIQQREIREILVHINQWAQIDTDNFFLNKLKELNNQAEQNWNLEIKYLVDMKDNVRVTSSQLRFELESELEYNSASENLKSVLEWRMTLAIEEWLNDPKELGRLVIDSLIEIKWLEWANSQVEQWGLDIPKSDFYRILAKAFIRMEKSEVKKFRDSIIHITLQGTPEIFRGDDKEISKILDIIIGAEKEEPTDEQESVIDRPANNSSQKTGLVKPMSLEISGNVEKDFQEAFSSNSPERFFKFERYSQFSERSKEIASIICDTYNQMNNVDSSFFQEYQNLYTKDVLMWIQLTESGYKQDAESHANAVWVMQNMNISIRDNYLSILLLNKNWLNINNPGEISTETATEVQNIMKIDSNLWRSAWKIHFRMLVSPRYKISDMRTALAAYNAGHWVKGKPESKWPQEAQDYVTKNLQYQKNLALVSEIVPWITDNVRMRIVRAYWHSNGDITKEYVARKLDTLS